MWLLTTHVVLHQISLLFCSITTGSLQCVSLSSSWASWQNAPHPHSRETSFILSQKQPDAQAHTTEWAHSLYRHGVRCEDNKKKGTWRTTPYDINRKSSPHGNVCWVKAVSLHCETVSHLLSNRPAVSRLIPS